MLMSYGWIAEEMLPRCCRDADDMLMTYYSVRVDAQVCGMAIENVKDAITHDFRFGFFSFFSGSSEEAFGLEKAPYAFRIGFCGSNCMSDLYAACAFGIVFCGSKLMCCRLVYEKPIHLHAAI